MLFFALTAHAQSCIRWLDVVKSNDVDVALVKIEGAKTGDRIYLMENTMNGNEKSWEPKCFYTIPENADMNNLALNMPDVTQPNHTYALALKDKENTQLPVYSKPFAMKENEWTETDKQSFKAEAAKVEKDSADKKKNGKKATSSANGTTFSIGIACIVLGSLLL